MKFVVTIDCDSFRDKESETINLLERLIRKMDLIGCAGPIPEGFPIVIQDDTGKVIVGATFIVEKVK